MVKVVWKVDGIDERHSDEHYAAVMMKVQDKISDTPIF